MATLFSKASKRKRPADGAPGPAGAPARREGPTKSRPAPAPNALTTTFSDLGLCAPLAATCRKLGFSRPTAVQRAIIPQILAGSSGSGRSGGTGGGGHLLTLSATGSGKTAAFALPLLHILSADPYGIFALILTPTRELAKQIQQQILALGSGSGWKITCALIIGGEDPTRQSLELGKQPNFVVATPGRCAELCRDGDGGGLYRPNFRKVRFVVLDEADRLLSARSGFERDVAECLLQSTTTMSAEAGKRVRRTVCRTLLFSATMTRSLASLEEMAGAGAGRLPLTKVVVREDGTWDDGEVEKSAKKKRKSETEDDSGESADQKKGERNEGSGSDDSESEDESSTPNIPAGLRQEYIFMPSRVREAYLLCAIRTLMTHGGRGKVKKGDDTRNGSGWNHTDSRNVDVAELMGRDDDEAEEGGGRRKYPLAQSAIIFVPTCERCAHVSGILTELGIKNVALHSLLSQNRRLASLGMFQSQRVRVLVATDVASRGLDVPAVDLVINAELPRRAVDYVHRVGRTARAGRRGRAISLVGEQDTVLVHEAERISGRPLEKCEEVTDDMAVRLLGPVAKASRLTKMKLMDIGFDELVAKHRERKRRDRRRREKAERRARKAVAKLKESK
ncbi:hypothetical protein ACHAXT_001112 [Thalassiosira profunda]